MKISSSSIIAKISLVSFTLVIFSLASFWFFKNKNKNELSKEEQFSRVMPMLVKKISERWVMGDLEGEYARGKFHCSDISNQKSIDPSYFQCNPFYFKCFLEGNIQGIESSFYATYKNKKYEVKIIKTDNEFFKMDFQGNLLLKIGITGFDNLSWQVKLLDICDDTYLPQRIYSAGSLKEQIRWDNFGQNIFVDKYYVSNADIYWWKKSQNKNLENLLDVADYPNASLNLSLAEKKQYCLDRGKILLQEHVFSAATYLPANLKNEKPEYVYKYPYPWNRNSSSIFLSKALRNKNYKLTKKDCLLAYVSGCERVAPNKLYKTDSSSWMGIHFPLGEHMEVFDNRFDIKKNLKLSSQYFAANSSVHKLGIRHFWNGEGFTELDIEAPDHFDNVKKIANDKNLGVAFRCMSYK